MVQGTEPHASEAGTSLVVLATTSLVALAVADGATVGPSPLVAAMTATAAPIVATAEMATAMAAQLRGGCTEVTTVAPTSTTCAGPPQTPQNASSSATGWPFTHVRIMTAPSSTSFGRWSR